MSEFVVGLIDVRERDVALVGRKAASLGALRAAGFPVPGGLCVTTAAYSLAFAPFLRKIDAVISTCDLRAPAEADVAAAQIDAILADLVVPTSVLEALQAACSKSLPGTALVAIRSSATAEDLDDVSFAGQYRSVLGVRLSNSHGRDLADAILTCWRSFFSANALVARARQDALGEQQAMAVLIQPMIDAECAGVCLSLDPVDTNQTTAVLSATWGLGESVVDGTTATDTIWMRRQDLRVDRRHVVEKSTQLICDPEAGKIRVPTPEDRRDAACLPDAWAQRVAQFTLAAENLFGAPQDVEWAIADGQVWLLQSRPLTGLPDAYSFDGVFPVQWDNEEDRLKLWTLVQIPEGESAALLPLQMDYLLLTEEVREETCRFMGAERNQRIKLINGRAYACSVPLGLSEADLRIRQAARQDLKERLQRQDRTLWDHWGPEIISATERLRTFDFESADAADLVRHLEDALAVRRRHYMLHPICSYKPNPSFFTAFSRLSGLVGEEAEAAAYGLLGGEETVLTRLIDDLYALAVTVGSEPEIASAVVDSPSDIAGQLAALPGTTVFARRLDEFLELYGDRTGDGYGSEATLLTPTWREDPSRVMDIVASYLTAGVPSPSAARMRSRQEQDDRAEALCAASADSVAVEEFRLELAYARRAYTILEEHNHFLDQMSTAHVRKAVLAAADRLVSQGILIDRDDLFWFTFDEILGALQAPLPLDHTESVTLRRDAHDAWRQLTPPPIVGIPDAELPERGPLQRGVTPDGAGQEGKLSGLGVSSGRYRGRARVVENSVVLPDVAAGDILVAENVGPRWTPLFPMLGGLILERGSPGQHAAATAREYGIPAVVHTQQATRRIPDGAWVTVDGATGSVEWEQL